MSAQCRSSWSPGRGGASISATSKLAPLVNEHSSTILYPQWSTGTHVEPETSCCYACNDLTHSTLLCPLVQPGPSIADFHTVDSPKSWLEQVESPRRLNWRCDPSGASQQFKEAIVATRSTEVSECGILEATDMTVSVLRRLGHSTQNVDVRYFESGAFSKLYTVDSADVPKSFPRIIFRITRGGTFTSKVDSEVASMLFANKHTSIPVPQIHAYDSSSDNSIGSAWMLLEYLDAKTLHHVRENMTKEQTRAVARQIADWTHQLRSLRFSSIGSIYLHNGQFDIGPLVSDYTARIERGSSEHDRGPFFNVEQYYRGWWVAELHRCLVDHRWDEPKEKRKLVSSIVEILDALPRLFPVNVISDPPCLHHIDMHEGNILIDRDYKAVGLIDWELAHVMPLAGMKSQLPKLLHRHRKENDYNTSLETPSKTFDAAFFAHMEKLEPGYSSLVDDLESKSTIHTELERPYEEAERSLVSIRQLLGTTQKDSAICLDRWCENQGVEA